jgi:hypothetical protein
MCPSKTIPSGRLGTWKGMLVSSRGGVSCGFAFAAEINMRSSWCCWFLLFSIFGLGGVIYCLGLEYLRADERNGEGGR